MNRLPPIWQPDLRHIITATPATSFVYGYVGVQRDVLPNLNFNERAEFNTLRIIMIRLSSTSLLLMRSFVDLHLLAGQLRASWFYSIAECNRPSSPDTAGAVFTLDQESSTVYASINHKLTPKLLGTVIGRWQHSVYNEGIYNNQADDYYSLGLNLSYSFTPHFSG